jgi:predicted transposase YdaD
MAITIDIKEDTLYQEGLQKGQEEGKLAGKEQAAVNMLRKGMSIELIREITELAAERIAQLKQQLEAAQ